MEYEKPIPCEVKESSKSPWKFEVRGMEGHVYGLFMTRQSAENAAQSLQLRGFIEAD